MCQSYLKKSAADRRDVHGLQTQRLKAFLVSQVARQTVVEASVQKENAANVIASTKGQDASKVTQKKLKSAGDCNATQADAGAARTERDDCNKGAGAKAVFQEDQQGSSMMSKEGKDGSHKDPLGCAMATSNAQAPEASEVQVEHVVGMSPPQYHF